MQVVAVYRNLLRKGFVFNIKDPKTGLVIDRSETVYLKDCTMKVSEAGRQRVLKERRKNVHSYIVGKRLKHWPAFKGTAMIARRIKYNPYISGYFYIDEGVQNFGWPVLEAEYVTIEKGVVCAWEKLK